MKKTQAKKKLPGVFDLQKINKFIHLDLGCGENKKKGSIGVDFRKVKGVDIVQDLNLFPWKIESDVAEVITASHLLEHINPAPSDPRMAKLIDLLKDKKILSEKEVSETIGDYVFLGGLIRFMDECWRILKTDGQLLVSFPYAFSPGYAQDPTHLCPINHITMTYFDPLAKDPSGSFYNLYTIYRPFPWKIIRCFYDVNGFVEIAMEKRRVDSSYRVLKNEMVDNNL